MYSARSAMGQLFHIPSVAKRIDDDDIDDDADDDDDDDDNYDDEDGHHHHHHHHHDDHHHTYSHSHSRLHHHHYPFGGCNTSTVLNGQKRMFHCSVFHPAQCYFCVGIEECGQSSMNSRSSMPESLRTKVMEAWKQLFDGSCFARPSDMYPENPRGGCTSGSCTHC